MKRPLLTSLTSLFSGTALTPLTILSSLTILTLSMLLSPTSLYGQSAVAREYTRSFLTYPYGDPNPVGRPGKIYPYFRFDAYTTKGAEQN